jgi:hypothetical protein
LSSLSFIISFTWWWMNLPGSLSQKSTAVLSGYPNLSTVWGKSLSQKKCLLLCFDSK